MFRIGAADTLRCPLVSSAGLPYLMLRRTVVFFPARVTVILA